MAKINRAFREHLVHNILNNLITDSAYLRLSLYNTERDVDENTKLSDLGDDLKDTVEAEDNHISAATPVPAPTNNSNSDGWDIKIAGKYYRLTTDIDIIEQSDKYWDTLIAEFNTTGMNVKYNTRALIYSENDENGKEIPILIEKFPVERDLEKPTITCIVKF